MGTSYRSQKKNSMDFDVEVKGRSVETKNWMIEDFYNDTHFGNNLQNIVEVKPEEQK